MAGLPDDRQFLEDVWEGLAATPKALPAKYFYDAAGSELFEGITGLAEYYPTRTELRILDEHGPAIAAALPSGAALVEFGAGSTVKVRRLLRHLRDLRAYVPVDVSGEFLTTQAEGLRSDIPGLAVEPIVADFTRPFALPPSIGDAPRAGFFPGSTIGNFRPDEAIRLLDTFGTILGTGAQLIVGVDLVKDTGVLEAAYDDASGVTAAFNLNLLTRINRELAGGFTNDGFRHRAFFNAAASRIEMHLVSCEAQEIDVAGRRFGFAAGESIHTENSYKYSIASFRELAAQAGWAAGEVWTDPDALFSVHALRRQAV
ncbi:L-histidine N(alpha)-methyltransferase [Methylobacterium haplocladii]|uniref:L-histidine N(alpha)-methyltransferase n=1 Tax=Methylobacterium haplocladii TaxID=1176176 RepID=UPI001EDD4C5F|nr:L-histidine N(alpha)-methyltransferase [Methylobacterium haplocladii]